uniref:MICOS complex subunit MIC19-like n=1 Tax=Hirondellea gigas TaxID=1518452 RepID=A0A2P2HXI9_9CRUS
MGSSQSTRKITLVNDDKSGVIKLSENLAHRLRGQLEESEANAARPPPSPPSPSPYIPPPVAAAVPTPLPSTPPRASTPPPHYDSSRNGADAWTSVYAEEARRALMRLQAEQDEAIAAVEHHWQKKMADREQQFVESAKLSVSEMEKTASDVEATFVKSTVTPVCLDCQSKVLSCYQQYPGQTLRCFDVVQQFTRCVDLTRLVSPAQT